MGQFIENLLIILRTLIDFIFHVYALIFWPDKKGTIPQFTDRLLLKPATELSSLIKSGKLTSESVVKAYIKRIKEVNPLTNSIIDERFDEAIEDAKAIDRAVQAHLNGEGAEDDSILEKPLLGVPFSCKDSMSIKGLRLCSALPQRKNVRADTDAAVIVNLKAAGCIPLVVCNVPEMLLWWTADNKTFGRTNNPYDLSRIAGGSGGGDGSILSGGGVILSVGSDVGGSLRIPCCMCGLFGHKTTSGIISAEGKWPPLSQSRERYFSLGPMARFACDLKPMLKAMAGQAIKRLPRIDDSVDFSKLTFYYMLDDEDPFKTRVDPQIKENILSIVAHFNQTYKSKMRQVVYTDFRHCTKMFLAAIQETGGDPMIKLINDGNRGSLNVHTEFIKSFLGFGAHTLHVTLFSLIQHYLPPPGSKFSIEAIKMRDKLCHELGNLLSENSVLILPSYPTDPPKHGTTIPNNQNIHYFTMLNLLGLPATQVPIGLSKKNSMPLGIQVAADKYNDHLTLAVAEEIEKLLGGWVPPAPFINHQTAPI